MRPMKTTIRMRNVELPDDFVAASAAAWTV
jgi:hypothetical protein